MTVPIAAIAEDDNIVTDKIAAEEIGEAILAGSPFALTPSMPKS